MEHPVTSGFRFALGMLAAVLLVLWVIAHLGHQEYTPAQQCVQVAVSQGANPADCQFGGADGSAAGG